ncbi:MAG: hypothetical protein BWX47_01958 [candidate division Hyd24-12 bacterium ADurb.Bin004]|nr:MAG: hypothetical protein BWX47_01958 [candidate division Hyd24-12 bacterium ADurb.Bin004]
MAEPTAKESILTGERYLNREGATGPTASRRAAARSLISATGHAESRLIMCSSSLALAVRPTWHSVHRGRAYLASSRADSLGRPFWRSMSASSE